MAENLGARVNLENAKLKASDLAPWEIWLSESQERMVLAVPPEKWPRLEALCAGEGVEAAAIGTFEGTGRLHFHPKSGPGPSTATAICRNSWTSFARW